MTGEHMGMSHRVTHHRGARVGYGQKRFGRPIFENVYLNNHSSPTLQTHFARYYTHQTIIFRTLTRRSESIPSGGRCNIPVAYNHSSIIPFHTPNDSHLIPFHPNVFLKRFPLFPVIYSFIFGVSSFHWIFPKSCLAFA